MRRPTLLVAAALAASALLAYGGTAHAELPPLPPPGPSNTPPATTAPPQPLPAPSSAPDGSAGAPVGAASSAPPLVVEEPSAYPSPAPPPPEKKLVPYVSLGAGLAIGRIFDIAERQGDFRLALGAHSNHFAIFGYADLLYGDTTAGLRVTDYTVGMGMDGRVDRFRFGGGLFLGLLHVQRVTFDSHASADTAGAFVHTSADVYRFGFRGDHAAFVDLMARGEVFVGGNTGQLVLSVGFRY